jgi:hypothetical protein
MLRLMGGAGCAEDGGDDGDDDEEEGDAAGAASSGTSCRGGSARRSSDGGEIRRFVPKTPRLSYLAPKKARTAPGAEKKRQKGKASRAAGAERRDLMVKQYSVRDPGSSMTFPKGFETEKRTRSESRKYYCCYWNRLIR